MSEPGAAFEAVHFSELAGWQNDRQGAAFAAFLVSARRLLQVGVAGHSSPPQPGLIEAAQAAVACAERVITDDDARRFFEAHFVPHRITHTGPAGLLTGYYEPTIDGSRVRDAKFCVPILRRPADLVNLVAETERGAKADALTHARKTHSGVEPYSTRADIENGALKDQGLELFWIEDPVDVFFLHVQGSGRIRLPDGTLVRVTYDGKNGHPYTSVGRYLIDMGAMTAEDMTLDALKDWLRSDPERGRTAMHCNRSFVFFRELTAGEAEAPLGAMEIPLTPGRSLAVDTRYTDIGSPVWVTSPALSHAGDPSGFRRLMVAQDVGSAIRGPERGDIFFGSGDEAGRLAGITKHPGSFIVLRSRMLR